MVKFNSGRKPIKAKKVKKITIKTNATKPNKPKVVYETSFLKGRYLWALTFMTFSLCALIARAAYVQIVNVADLVEEADKRSLRTQEIQSIRGSILDRNGQYLSVSVPMYSIVSDPKVVLEANGLEQKDRWKALADAIGMPYKELVKIIQSHPRSRFEYLARQVSPSVADYVKQLKPVVSTHAVKKPHTWSVLPILTIRGLKVLKKL